MENLVVNFSGSIRRERIGNRRFIVANLTMIIPGVLNGSRGALFYPAEEVAKSAPYWDGVILTSGHLPEGINGHRLETQEKYALGFVQKPVVKNGHLKAEGWFDEERTKQLNINIYNSLIRRDKIELSTGLDVDFDDTAGQHNGRFYNKVVRNYRPDHLAVLVNERGACSLMDGCGVNNAKDAKGHGSNKHGRKDIAGSYFKVTISPYTHETAETGEHKATVHRVMGGKEYFVESYVYSSKEKAEAATKKYSTKTNNAKKGWSAEARKRAAEARKLKSKAKRKIPTEQELWREFAKKLSGGKKIDKRKGPRGYQVDVDNAWSPEARKAAAEARKAKAGLKKVSPSSATKGVKFKGRSDKDKVWHEALKKADTQAATELTSHLSGVHSIEISGNYVQEPVVSAKLSGGHQQAVKELRSKGWKGRQDWNREESITLAHPETGHTITIDKMGINKGVRYFPQYDLESFNLPNYVDRSGMSSIPKKRRRTNNGGPGSGPRPGQRYRHKTGTEVEIHRGEYIHPSDGQPRISYRLVRKATGKVYGTPRAMKPEEFHEVFKFSKRTDIDNAWSEAARRAARLHRQASGGKSWDDRPWHRGGALTGHQEGDRVRINPTYSEHSHGTIADEGMLTSKGFHTVKHKDGTTAIYHESDLASTNRKGVGDRGRATNAWSPEARQAAIEARRKLGEHATLRSNVAARHEGGEKMVFAKTGPRKSKPAERAAIHDKAAEAHHKAATASDEAFTHVGRHVEELEHQARIATDPAEQRKLQTQANELRDVLHTYTQEAHSHRSSAEYHTRRSKEHRGITNQESNMFDPEDDDFEGDDTDMDLEHDDDVDNEEFDVAMEGEDGALHFGDLTATSIENAWSEEARKKAALARHSRSSTVEGRKAAADKWREGLKKRVAADKKKDVAQRMIEARARAEGRTHNAWSEQARKAAALSRKLKANATGAKAAIVAGGAYKGSYSLKQSVKPVRGKASEVVSHFHHISTSNPGKSIAQLEDHFKVALTPKTIRKGFRVSVSGKDGSRHHYDLHVDNSTVKDSSAKSSAAYVTSSRTNNRQEFSMNPLTEEQKAELVDNIVTNCDCYNEDDREELELLDDRYLTSIANGIINSEKAAELEAELDTVKSSVQNAQGGKLKLANMPEEVQRIYNYGQRAIEADKAALIDRLVINHSGDAQKARREQLSKLSIEELEDRVADLPAPVENREVEYIPQSRASFVGAGAGRQVANNNGKKYEPAGGALGLPVLNFEKSKN